MKFLAEIEILPHKGLLDPQGKAVTHSMASIGLPNIDNARIGKFITLEITADSAEAAKSDAESACKKLLANQIMETFQVRVHELS